MTHRERARIALTGGEPDFVPTFELVFHETERDFGGRTFFGGPAPPDRTGKTRRQMLEHNAQLFIDIARKFEHSIVMVTSVPNCSGDEVEQDLMDTVKIIRDKTGGEFFVVVHGDATYGIPSGSNMEQFVYRMVDDPEGMKEEKGEWGEVDDEGWTAAGQKKSIGSSPRKNSEHDEKEELPQGAVVR